MCNVIKPASSYIVSNIATTSIANSVYGIYYNAKGKRTHVLVHFDRDSKHIYGMYNLAAYYKPFEHNGKIIAEAKAALQVTDVSSFPTYYIGELTRHHGNHRKSAHHRHIDNVFYQHMDDDTASAFCFKMLQYSRIKRVVCGNVTLWEPSSLSDGMRYVLHVDKDVANWSAYVGKMMLDNAAALGSSKTYKDGKMRRILKAARNHLKYRLGNLAVSYDVKDGNYDFNHGVNAFLVACRLCDYFINHDYTRLKPTHYHVGDIICQAVAAVRSRLIAEQSIVDDSVIDQYGKLEVHQADPTYLANNKVLHDVIDNVDPVKLVAHMKAVYRSCAEAVGEGKSASALLRRLIEVYKPYDREAENTFIDELGFKCYTAMQTMSELSSILFDGITRGARSVESGRIIMEFNTVNLTRQTKAFLNKDVAFLNVDITGAHINGMAKLMDDIGQEDAAAKLVKYKEAESRAVKLGLRKDIAKKISRALLYTDTFHFPKWDEETLAKLTASQMRVYNMAQEIRLACHEAKISVDEVMDCYKDFTAAALSARCHMRELLDALHNETVSVYSKLGYDLPHAEGTYNLALNTHRLEDFGNDNKRDTAVLLHSQETLYITAVILALKQRKTKWTVISYQNDGLLLAHEDYGIDEQIPAEVRHEGALLLNEILHEVVGDGGKYLNLSEKYFSTHYRTYSIISGGK